MNPILVLSLVVLLGFTTRPLVAAPSPAAGTAGMEEAWVVYRGKAGPGRAKHVVLISGDEEYRSEEALTQLGRILAVYHGFKCTVLFAIEAGTSFITGGTGR